MSDVVLHEITWNHEGEFYARGHLTPTAFLAAYGREIGRDDELLTLESHVVHLWGRWVPSRGEFDRVLHLCDGPARGAFPFTMLENT